MKMLPRFLTFAALALADSSALHAQDVTTLQSWTSSDGRVIQAKFVKPNGESVVIEEDGKQFPSSSANPDFRLALAPAKQPSGSGAAPDSGAGADGPPASIDEDFRSWTNTAGKVIEAQMVELLPESRSVRLRLRDGKTHDFPLARLSEADRTFVAGWKPAKGQQSRADGEEWTVLDDERSSLDCNAAIDLVRVALRQPPDQPNVMEFLATFRKGTPDRGVLSIWLDSDRTPTTGGSYGAEFTLLVNLDQTPAEAYVQERNDGGWKKIPAFRARAVRTEDRIYIRIDGWTLKDFNYRVMLSAPAHRIIGIPIPQDNPGRVIKVDGQIDDWAGAEPVWQATEDELPPAHCVADPRSIWSSRRGDSLLLRIQFPDQAVLWAKDGDIECRSTGVGIRLLPAKGEWRQPKLWYILPKEVKGMAGGQDASNPSASFQWNGSEMEIAMKDLPKDEGDLRIGLLFRSQKFDEIQGGVFRARNMGVANAGPPRKPGSPAGGGSGVTLLQHKLLACEMDLATADALEKRLAGDAAAANLAYEKIPALVKQGKIREIARSELGVRSGSRGRAPAQGKTIKTIDSVDGTADETTLGLRFELEATLLGDDLDSEVLRTAIEVVEQSQSGQFFRRRTECSFSRFPVGRPVVFWRWDEGPKSTLLIGSCDPVPRPPALVAGPAVSILRFALYECPPAMVPDVMNNAEALPAKAAAILAAKATLTTGGFFAYEPSGGLKGTVRSALDADYWPPDTPLTFGILGTQIEWEATSAAQGKSMIRVSYLYGWHPSPVFFNDGNLRNPELLNELRIDARVSLEDGEVKVLCCKETQGLGSAKPVTRANSHFFLVLQRETP